MFSDPGAAKPEDFTELLQHWQQVVSLVSAMLTGTLGSAIIFFIKVRREWKANVQPAVDKVEQDLPKALDSVQKHKINSEHSHAVEQKSLIDIRRGLISVRKSGKRRDEKLELMSGQIENIIEQMEQMRHTIQQLSGDTSVIFTHLIKKQQEGGGNQPHFPQRPKQR